MRLVTWNCNGALRKKYHVLSDICADIIVVQECEDPAFSSDKDYVEWAGAYVWCGLNKNKGIGVFARSGFTLKAVGMPSHNLELFLPVVINDRWPLLAVWTRYAQSPTFGYIGQLWKYIQIYGDFLKRPGALLAGDFNSNACWDKSDRWWNHSDVVRWLGDNGIYSVWHQFMNERHGEETKGTFFMYRNEMKKYHIDYIFCENNWSVDCVKIGEAKKWLECSDHVPLIAELSACGIF